MTTHTELAATHTSFAVSLGDTLRESLWGFRQRSAQVQANILLTRVFTRH